MRKFLVVSATADERVSPKTSSNVYDEETMKSSDLENWMPNDLYATLAHIEEVKYLNKNEKPVKWYMAVTRIE